MCSFRVAHDANSLWSSASSFWQHPPSEVATVRNARGLHVNSGDNNPSLLQHFTVYKELSHPWFHSLLAGLDSSRDELCDPGWLETHILGLSSAKQESWTEPKCVGKYGRGGRTLGPPLLVSTQAF